MDLRINNNITASVAQRNLSINSMKMQDTMEKLSSGHRINNAVDDASGLNISELLSTQVRGSQMALRNAQDGLSMMQIAEGSLQNITENVSRIRDLCVQMANDTYSSSDRLAMGHEIVQRARVIQTTALNAKFSNIELFSGRTSVANIQTGANAQNTERISISSAVQALTLDSLFSGNLDTADVSIGGISAHMASTARAFIGIADRALEIISERRNLLGSYQTQLSKVIDNLQVGITNLSASESRIRDVNVAQATTNLSKFQVLQKSSVSMLAQANQMPQTALKLLS